VQGFAVQASNDIRGFGHLPRFGEILFRPVTTLDSYGREQPSYDMTRDGFTLLVMGWTDEPDG